MTAATHAHRAIKTGPFKVGRRYVKTLTFKVGRTYTCELMLPENFERGARFSEKWLPHMPVKLSTKDYARLLAGRVQAIALVPSHPKDKNPEYLIRDAADYACADSVTLALLEVTDPFGAKVLAAWLDEQEAGTP
jgi:hypothetical protein